MQRGGKWRPIGTVLVESGAIDESQLQAALAEQQTSDRRLGEILIDSGAITWNALAHAIAEQVQAIDDTDDQPYEPEPDQPALLAASFEGLSYPDWKREFGWRAVGERTDELDGRDAHTVYYKNSDGARIGYTIVAGDALPDPPGAERSVVDGVELAAFNADAANGVTWLRDGHSCVLAGEGVKRSTLLELAAWKGDGAVTF